MFEPDIIPIEQTVEKTKRLNNGGVFMKLTYMQQLDVVLKYKSGEGTYERITKEYEIKLSSLHEIVSKYESLGKEGLKDTRQNMKYSNELKRRALEMENAFLKN